MSAANTSVFSCELNKNAQGHSGEPQLPGMPLFGPLGLAGKHQQFRGTLYLRATLIGRSSSIALLAGERWSLGVKGSGELARSPTARPMHEAATMKYLDKSSIRLHMTGAGYPVFIEKS